MHDPHEGITPDGMIRTGARRAAVPSTYVPVLEAAVGSLTGPAGLYVYGSVATGTASVPTSDVDLLAIDLPTASADRLTAELTSRFADRCRAVSVGAASRADLAALNDEGHGLRVFLRHYCVHLAGPDPAAGLPDHRADAAAARGFNGDIGQHLQRWRDALEDDVEVAPLATRIARKTLLAVAGLVSIRDATWSTDRRACATRWGELEPAASVDILVTWLDAPPHDRDAVERVLDRTVPTIVTAFEREIGLW
ncbi:MAG: nucleotidyltransferase domain-containing protein [Nitriliruptoraceae bacterium]|nr:nucleotidyltransferase domain-containing protein [Nitriliruptoraceae bacterium]